MWLVREESAARVHLMPMMRENRRYMLTMEVPNLWLATYNYEESIKLIQQNRALFDQFHDVDQC